jgi:hypothetical protein
MKLPAFDKNGSIDMMEVISAKPKDFEQFGIKVEEVLSSIKKELAGMGVTNYSKEKANYFHELLDEYATANGRMRKPFYQHSGNYCFYYNLFCRFVSNSIYYKLDDNEEQKLDQEILDCEIRLAKNPNSFYGRSNEELIKSYKGHTVMIPKGCPIKTDGIPNIVMAGLMKN